MANEISIGISLGFKKNGESLSLSGTETYDQVGEFASGSVQDIGAETVQLDLGSVTGDKFLMLKNLEPKDTANTTSPVIFVDSVTPVVPASAPIKLGGSHPDFRPTAIDTWYAIAVGGAARLGVVAVQQ